MKQQISGLGVEAQREIIHNHVKNKPILAVGSHFMIEYAIQFLFMNMVTDHFNCPIFLPPPH